VYNQYTALIVIGFNDVLSQLLFMGLFKSISPCIFTASEYRLPFPLKLLISNWLELFN